MSGDNNISLLHPCNISSQARNMDEKLTSSLPVAGPMVGADLHAADRAFDAFSLALQDKKLLETCSTGLWNHVLRDS